MCSLYISDAFLFTFLKSNVFPYNNLNFLMSSVLSGQLTMVFSELGTKLVKILMWWLTKKMARFGIGSEETSSRASATTNHAWPALALRYECLGTFIIPLEIIHLKNGVWEAIRMGSIRIGYILRLEVPILQYTKWQLLCFRILISREK